MPRSVDECGPARSPASSRGAAPKDRLFDLVRSSHIFASLVREILEVQLLREASPLPLTVSQFHLLKLMSVDGQHQLGQVADFLGVSPPAATKNIDKLERLGLVVRTPSKGDRRATLLSVSPKGRRLVRKYEGLKVTRLAPLLDRYRAAELTQLSELLQRFSISLLELEQPGPSFCLRCGAYLEDDCPVGRVRGGCPYQKVSGARPTQSADVER